MFWHVSVHHSVCPHLRGGGSTLIGGTPPQVPPWSDLARGGTLHQAPPCQTWLGGYPGGGDPTSGTPPGQTWLGGYPDGGYPTSYRITDGVLDMPRSVCLLHSRRRTFLFTNVFLTSVHMVQQDSPVWLQEAYCTTRSKHLLSCLRGVPLPWQGGTSILARGTPILAWSTPILAWGTSILDWGTPAKDLGPEAGAPPGKDMGPEAGFSPSVNG